MQLIRDISQQRKPCVLTIGNFDGVHLGHQALLRKLMQAAEQAKLPTMVMMFEPQPNEYFSKEKMPPRLMSVREKYFALQKFPIDTILCLRFNEKIAAMSATDFVCDILVKKLAMRYMIVGDDFRFGKNRQGDFSLLQQLGRTEHYQTLQMPTFLINQQRISSTQIRQLLQSSDFEMATKLLGRPFQLSGHVTYGDGRGRQLGFPTANIHLTRNNVPVVGIYVVKVHGLQRIPLWGAASIGIRPTLPDNRQVLEVHILDFNDTIYGQRISLEFLHKIRDEAKFSDLEKLRQQIALDVQQVRIISEKEG